MLNDNAAGAILLGDKGYPLTPWLMTIYRNPDTQIKQAYNKLHINERTIIERLFGQLKQRFPILYSKIRVKTERIPSFVTACFVLFNVSKFLNDPVFEHEEEFDDDEPFGEDENLNNLGVRGARRRDQIAAAIAGLWMQTIFILLSMDKAQINICSLLWF